MMSIMVSFCAVLFPPRGVLDEILNLIESVSEGFPSYSFIELIWLIVVILERGKLRLNSRINRVLAVDLLCGCGRSWIYSGRFLSSF